MSSLGQRKLWRIPVADFELILILGDLKCHCGPIVKVGDYGSHLIDGVLAEVRLVEGKVCP